jgi:CheY-like chemotaxis protein
VEDDAVITADIKSRLGKMPLYYSLHSKKNGEDALLFLKEELDEKRMLVDIIIIDPDLPDMTGFELLSIIRAREELKHLKCFIISTPEKKIDQVEAKRLGVSGYIEEPLTLNNRSSIDAFNLIIDIMNMKTKDVNL